MSDTDLPDEAGPAAASPHGDFQRVDDELRRAIQLELWELRESAADSAQDAPAELDPETFHAARLLNNVFVGGVQPEIRQQPEQISRFQVRSLLGLGRFGVVWKAFDPASNREVALKVIHQSQLYAEAHRRRFLRECSLAARLDHPAIVPVYEAGTSEGMPYLVMPVCDGQTLDKWFAAQPQPVPARLAAQIAQRISEAAAHGHQNGILHRDLKPGNVMVSSAMASPGNSELTIRILDFGLAIPLDVTLRDTRGSLIAGTPVYMSPEQAECRTDEIGVGSDVFSIGAILYELLTGLPPFQAPTLPAVIERLQSETAASIRDYRKDVPADLDAVCLKCLAHEPRQRYASAQALAADLERFLQEQPVTARPLGRLQRWLIWCSLRRGQQQLALTAVAINVVIMLWGVASLPAAFAEIPPGQMSLSAVLPILGPLCGVIVPLHVLLIWLSLQIRRLRDIRRHSLIALGLSAATLGYALSVLFDVAPAAPSPAYAENPFARNVAFTLVATGFAMLTGIYALLAAGRPKSS